MIMRKFSRTCELPTLWKEPEYVVTLAPSASLLALSSIEFIVLNRLLLLLCGETSVQGRRKDYLGERILKVIQLELAGLARAVSVPNSGDGERPFPHEKGIVKQA